MTTMQQLLPLAKAAALGGALLLSPVSAGRAPAAAQEGLPPPLQPPPAAGTPAAQDPPSEPAEPEIPPVSELVPRVARMGEEAEEALAVVRELASLTELEPRVRELGERQEDLAGRLEGTLGEEYASDDRVAVLAEEAAHLSGRLGDVMEEVSGRVETLAELRGEWQDRRRLWRRWDERLAADPELQAAYAGEVARAQERIDEVLLAANRALPELVGLQQELRRTIDEGRRLHGRAQGFLRTWRKGLFTRTQPVLFSAGHREALGPGFGAPLARGLDEVRTGEWRLRPRHLGVLLLQAVVFLVVGGFARRLRPRVGRESRWAVVLRHPWAVGVLVAAAGGGLLYGPIPPLGRLALEAAVAGATVLVAAGMFRSPFKRYTVYGVSALYVVFAALEAVALPVPLLRIVLVALAAAGSVGLFVAERRAAGSSWADQRGFLWVLRIGAAALAAIVLAEILGYHFLAQWCLEAAVATAFVVFVVSFLARLARGAIHVALASEEVGRFRFVRRVGAALAGRLAFLVKLVLAGWAILYVASIWDLAESPGRAWSALVGAGFTVAGRELTVGRLLAAVVAVYLAFVASWVLRVLLDESFFERRRFERGVRDSIATLLHYAVIVVGVFVGLSVFGVDLTNFALIAGALGVGIGFGLQNVVNNFVSGLILLFERPVRVGDVVVLGEDWGTVEKIGLRSTVIVTFNGSELIVPNGNLIAEKVTNWTLTTPKARLVLPVGVAYGNDPARVIEVLEEIGRGYPLALEDPPPMAIFTGFGDSSLDFELRVWLGAFEQLLQTRSELASAILRGFAEEGIVIPFPQRDLHLRSVEPEAAGQLGGGSEEGSRGSQST